ncbi:hypothetical protein M885DRAFT_269142 [Pelagophyceae sp. CCMP2097]|nr:hypothetical protein M885DRAFT_269142 [Pelagophyceae sp. CCMP2097]
MCVSTSKGSGHDSICDGTSRPMRLRGALALLLSASAPARPFASPECAEDPWVRPGRGSAAEPNARDFTPYNAPRARGGALSRNGAGEPAALVFVHVSKCAGTTLKQALAAVSKTLHLDAPYTLFRRTWPRFLQACARGDPLCARDVYVGTNTLGACDFIQRDRCLYATVLRDPVARLLSSWRYFCVQGAENKKGWDRGWTKCAWSIEQWAAMQPAQLTLDLSTNQAPTQRVARSNQTATCPLLADGPASERTGKRGEEHLAAALANLDATCHMLPRRRRMQRLWQCSLCGGVRLERRRRDSPVRVLLVDDLERGLRALAIELG